MKMNAYDPEMETRYISLRSDDCAKTLLSQLYEQNKNLAIANRSRVSCAHNSSRASP